PRRTSPPARISPRPRARPSRARPPRSRTSVSCVTRAPALNGRQLDDEGGACAELRADLQAAAHPAHQLAGDVEAEARPAGTRQRRPGPVELVEDACLLGGREARARVLH